MSDMCVAREEREHLAQSVLVFSLSQTQADSIRSFLPKYTVAYRSHYTHAHTELK